MNTYGKHRIKRKFRRKDVGNRETSLERKTTMLEKLTRIHLPSIKHYYNRVIKIKNKAEFKARNKNTNKIFGWIQHTLNSFMVTEHARRRLTAGLQSGRKMVLNRDFVVDRGLHLATTRLHES